jgi:ATP-dependent RNA helicase SUPV3L1/SUV3
MDAAAQLDPGTQTDAPDDANAQADDGPALAEELKDAPEANDAAADEAHTAAVEAAAPDAPLASDEDSAAPDETAAPEKEVFYTFTWAGAGRSKGGPRRGAGEQRQGRGKSGGPKGKRGGPRADKPKGAQNFSARPPKPEKKIDPDNPFAAALMGLKDTK